MGHVFISYHSEDGEFVADVIRQLEDAGFQVWLDHERLRAEGKWRESIDTAIRDAFALLVILTPAARDSEQIMYEWMFALGVGVRVIPIIREATKLPPRLEPLTHLEFTTTTGLPWGKLIRLIQEAFDSHRDQSPPRPTSFPSRSGSRGRPSLLDRARRPSDRPSFGRASRSRRNEWSGGLDKDTENDVSKLIEALEDKERDKRSQAAARLGELGAKEAIPALIARLRDDDYRVREDAARALGKLKATGAVLGLLEAIRQSRPGPFGGGGQSFFIDALNQIGVMAVPVLVDALSDEDPRMRLTIVDLLGEIGETDAVTALASALRDPEWRVRWRAADALGKLGDPAAVPDLLAMLADDSKDVRVSAAWALGRIGHDSAIEGLAKLLHDREWRVRWGAAEALWEIGAAAIPALIELLREQDDYVRRAAMRALAQIGSPAIPALIAALEDSNWDVRWTAANALHEIGDAAVPALVEALDGDHWQATWAAADTLKRIGTPDAMEAVDKWREGRGSDAPDDLVAPREDHSEGESDEVLPEVENETNDEPEG
jgi:HEAT repeat protein